VPRLTASRIKERPLIITIIGAYRVVVSPLKADLPRPS
jgi:hypothetical protein